MRKGRERSKCYYRIKSDGEQKKKKKKIFFFFRLGIFCLELGKKHTFWHWEWGRISAPKSGDREPCLLNTTINFKIIEKCLVRNHA